MPRRRPGTILGTSTFAILLVLSAVPAHADDMFLQLGDVAGDVTAAPYQNWINIASWSWGATNSTTVAAGTGYSAGKAAVSALTLMKSADSGTPRLVDAVVRGAHFPQGSACRPEIERRLGVPEDPARGRAGHFRPAGRGR